MPKNVSYISDSVNKEVLINYENDEEDLIECFIKHSLQITAMYGRKLAIVEQSCFMDFCCEDSEVKLIQQYNQDLIVISIPNKKVQELKAFYLALDKQCLVSY